VQPGTPRERARAQTIADIISIGREHLATDGAAALSLRAVARDLGVVSSAVYRYVASRDELLTLLVVDAYNELGDAVDDAVAHAPAEDPGAGFLAAAHAVRAWAVDQPARYGLIYGTPVPGYNAPGDITTPAGTRVIAVLLRLIERGVAAGVVDPSPAAPIPRVLRADFKAIRANAPTSLPDGALGRAFLAWTALFGAVSFEVFGQFGADTFSDPALIFDHQMRLIVGALLAA